MHIPRSKPLISLLIITSLILLTGCEITFGEKKDTNSLKVQNLENRVDQLQKELQEAKKAAELKAETPQVATTATVPAPTIDTSKKGNFIIIDSPADKGQLGSGLGVFYEHPIKFSGRVSLNTVKITVQATSADQPKVDEYTLQSYKPGSGIFSYGAAPQWNNLVEGSNTYIFTAYYGDGGSESISRTLYYAAGGAEMGKPVIYLYPTQTSKISVNVKPTGGISVSIPPINNGWNVVATPDGLITNLSDRKQYPYLFWEGFASDFTTPKEGFVVAKNQVSSFFDQTLRYQGMNEKEITDFKEFWVPKLTTKPYYFITYIDQDSIDRYAPLTVSPKPDTSIRIFFDYRGLDHRQEVTPQRLKAGVRNGFTLIEWGGRLYR